MHIGLFASTLTLALAISGAAFAQSATTAPNTPEPGAAIQQKSSSQTVPTIETIKQHLQNAGFSDIKVVQDAFLIEATTKDGNPVMMNIGPNGMSVLEGAKAGSVSPASTTGKAASKNEPASGPTNPAKN